MPNSGHDTGATSSKFSGQENGLLAFGFGGVSDNVANLGEAGDQTDIDVLTAAGDRQTLEKDVRGGHVATGLAVGESGKGCARPYSEELSSLRDRLVVITEVGLTRVIAPSGFEVGVGECLLRRPTLASVIGKDVGNACQVSRFAAPWS